MFSLQNVFDIQRERERARKKFYNQKLWNSVVFASSLNSGNVTFKVKKKTLWMELIEATTKKHRFMHCSSWLISFIWPCAKFGSTVHRDINIHYYPPSKVRTKCRKVYTFIFCVCMCVCACRIEKKKSFYNIVKRVYFFFSLLATTFTVPSSNCNNNNGYNNNKFRCGCICMCL